VYELALADYARVRPLFAGLRYNLAVDSILDGNTPAWVYVDDVADPRTAWLWDMQGEIFIAGETQNATTNRALAELITGKAIPHARARYIPAFTVFYDTPAWESQWGMLFPGLQAELTRRRYYDFIKPAVKWRAVRPVGSSIVRLNAHWLVQRDIYNMKQVLGWVDSFWRTHADFLRTGFGFCLLHEGAIASWCLTVFVSGHAYELGVATAPEYRGHGYALAVAARSVAFCAERGWTPHWHCEEDNIASWRIANRIGFINPTPYTVYRITL